MVPPAKKKIAPKITSPKTNEFRKAVFLEFFLDAMENVFKGVFDVGCYLFFELKSSSLNFIVVIVDQFDPGFIPQRNTVAVNMINHLNVVFFHDYVDAQLFVFYIALICQWGHQQDAVFHFDQPFTNAQAFDLVGGSGIQDVRHNKLSVDVDVHFLQTSSEMVKISLPHVFVIHGNN